MHWSRLLDSETMIFFGYIAKSEEKTGETVILQTDIVDTLIEDESFSSKTEEKSKRAALRASFKRRADALYFFGLINRPNRGKKVVAFELNALGKSHLDLFNDAFNAEIETMRSKK